MIESKYHAYEILKFVTPGKSEYELRGLVSLAAMRTRRGVEKIDEGKFWNDVILKSHEGFMFIKSRRINTLEELILSHYEWKMKYNWNIYKNIMPIIDDSYDEMDSSDYLD